MNDFLKSYGLLLLICLVLGLFAGISCRREPIQDKKVIAPMEVKINQEDRAILPDIKKKSVYKPSEAKIGHRIETDILEGTTRTVLVEHQIIDWGYANKLGLFGSAHLSTLDIGISYKTLYYWRANLDVLAGAKFGGAGVSFQAFRNTAIGGAWTYSWTTFLPSPSIYVSMGF